MPLVVDTLKHLQKAFTALEVELSLYGITDGENHKAK
jgi:hypothetical protein